MEKRYKKRTLILPAYPALLFPEGIFGQTGWAETRQPPSKIPETPKQ